MMHCMMHYVQKSQNTNAEEKKRNHKSKKLKKKHPNKVKIISCIKKNNNTQRGI